MLNDGWIKVHRKFANWEWWDDEKAVKLFIYMLFEANFETKKWQGIDIQKGQFVTSLNSLSKGANLSVRSIRTLLDKFTSTNEITIKTTSHFSIITVCNYETYQSLENCSDTPPTSNRQTSDTPPTTTKEIKKVRNKEIIHNTYIADFEKVWVIYRKGSKKKSYDQWLKLSEEIMAVLPERIEVYFKNRPEPKYRKDFERYIKDEAYNSQESLEILNGNQSNPKNGYEQRATGEITAESYRTVQIRSEEIAELFNEQHLSD